MNSSLPTRARGGNSPRWGIAHVRSPRAGRAPWREEPTVVADNVIHDITVYGYNESVFYKNGQPVVRDRGRELGMTNHISQVGS
jgi:hypothetical protein